MNSAQDTGWSKVDKVKVFVEDRLDPYPALYYLTAAEAQSAIEAGYDLAADIKCITHGRAVCRTDCKSPHIDRLNLPRTDSVSPDQAVSFMHETTDALKNKGALESEICFILHKFIPARVAAWAVARPDQQIVLVDTLWDCPTASNFCLTTLLKLMFVGKTSRPNSSGISPSSCRRRRPANGPSSTWLGSSPEGEAWRLIIFEKLQRKRRR